MKMKLLETDFKVKNKTVRINNSKCWICGCEFEDDNAMRTIHHCLPKHMQPKYNVLINVCQMCHIKINSKDFNGMVASVESMSKRIDKYSKEVGRLQKSLYYYMNDKNKKM